MKREHLYKAKRVDNGQWCEGSLIRKQQILSWICPIDEPKNYEVHPDTVCQFTGLLDKNGNKIFENDYDQNNEVVKWCKKRSGYSLFTYDYPTKDFIHCNCYSCEGYYEISDVINELEITGNIHDETH